MELIVYSVLFIFSINVPLAMFIYICTYTVYLSYSQAAGNYIWTSQIKAIQLKIGEDQNLEFKEASWIIFLQNEFDLFIYVFPDLRRQKKWWLNQRRETRGKKNQNEKDAKRCGELKAETSREGLSDYDLRIGS